jgi:CRISPR type IV-associated protein Csf1
MALESLTPTQFIRRAALQTGTVVTPTPWKERPADKKVRKSEANQVEVNGFVGIVMADPAIEDVDDVRCWLCGGTTNYRGVPVKKAILDTFTDRDKARWPKSKSVCPGCALCLSHLSLRNYSILATEKELRHPTRPEIRALLLDPPEPPFVLCIAVSGQKHLHFRAQVAYDRDGFPVQMEETSVCVWRGPLREWLALIESLYTVFSKEEIRTGRYGANRIRQYGLHEFQKLEDRLAPHRGTRLFDLAVFVAQKPPEKEKEEKLCRNGIQITSIAKNAEQQQSFFS